MSANTGPVPQLDINKIIAKIFIEYADRIGKTLSGQLLKSINALAGAFRSEFSDSLKITYEKCSRVKTILHRESPVPLLDIYTKLSLTNRTDKISDDKLITNLEDFKHVVITGAAGTGKTMFMRYLSIARFENSKGRIPIYVELRHLNQVHSKLLIPFIHYSATRASSKVTVDDFVQGLLSGSFLLILDGYDEVDPAERSDIEAQILDLCHRYPGNLVVVSSRPDDKLDSWESFHIFKVERMSKTQLVELIKKLNFDSEVKSKFISDVRRKLYDQHTSFLSNPLLATMMLLTYEQFASVPSKIHNFYDQAFVTLFLKHDALKSQYKRKTYTGLEIDNFRRCFAAFCRLTFVKSMFTFERSAIHAELQRAIDFCEYKISKENLLKDLMETVCVIQQDGSEYTFIHRSFQEYFCAEYLFKYAGHQFSKTMDILALRGSESVISMVFEMTPEMTERDWVLPRVQSVVLPVHDGDVAGRLGALFRLMVGHNLEIYLYPDGNFRFTFLDGTLDSAVGVINKLYKVERRPKKTSYRAMDDRNFIRALEGTGFDADARFTDFMGAYRKAATQRQKKGRVTKFDASSTRWRVEVNEKDSVWLSQVGIGLYLTDRVTGCIEVEKLVAPRVASREKLMDEL